MNVFVFATNVLNEFNKIKKSKNFFKKNNQKVNYSLLEDAFSSDDLIKGIEVILSKKLLWEKLLNFEKEFAEYVGSKYALMTNLGQQICYHRLPY